MFVALDGALTNLISPGFDPRHEVLLPAESRRFVAISNAAPVTIRKVDWALQRIRIEAESPEPVLLVLSQAHYHPWQARVDVEMTSIWPANIAFQAVKMPAGRHVVELTYADEAFRFGCGLSAAGFVFVGLLWRRARA